MLRFIPAATMAALYALAAFPASAHVTIETTQAPADSTYKAVFRVPHSCEGTATLKVRVQIPEGVVDVKPQPKAGWQLATTKGKLAQPYVSEGTTITEGVTEVIWSGGNLPDAFYDEFVLRAKLPNKPGTFVYFPIVQECEKGIGRWIEIPKAGKTPADYKQPAPRVSLNPKQ